MSTHESILFVSKSHIPSRHANAVQVVNMSIAMSRVCPSLELAIPFKPKRLFLNTCGRLFAPYGKKKPANMRVSLIKRTDRSDFGFEKAVVDMFKDRDDRIVFTRSIWVAHAFARLGRRVIFESHDFGKDAKHAFFLDFLKSLQSNPRLALVCTTETGTTMYLTAGAPSASVLTLHNGVDSNMFCCAEQNVLSRLFPPLARKIRPIVLYTGSLKTEKGAHLLVQAASRFPEFNFVIIGGTPSEIRGLTGSRSTPSNLFLHQSVSFRSIPSILSEANILTMPYQATGEFTPYMSSLKMFEYLASGNPIVSADLPVLRPVLKHGKNSFLYTPESLEGFGDALRIVSSLTPEQRTAVREAQLRTASEHTCDARAKQILSWYATRIQGKTECHP